MCANQVSSCRRGIVEQMARAQVAQIRARTEVERSAMNAGLFVAKGGAIGSSGHTRILLVLGAYGRLAREFGVMSQRVL